MVCPMAKECKHELTEIKQTEYEREIIKRRQYEYEKKGRSFLNFGQ